MPKYTAFNWPVNLIRFTVSANHLYILGNSTTNSNGLFPHNIAGITNGYHYRGQMQQYRIDGTHYYLLQWSR